MAAGPQYLAMYDLFEVYTFCATSYAKFVGEYGEHNPSMRRFKKAAAATLAEIHRRDQWGRYTFYTHNPEFFPNPRRIAPL